MAEKWARRSHVSRWWGDAAVLIEEIRNHEPSKSALIRVDGKPIGYLCWQVPTLQELEEAGLADLPANLIDIDIVIGEESALGQGYGPIALSQLLAKLRDEGVQFAGLGVAESNHRARKAYKKVGFRLFRAFTESGEKMRYLIKALHTE